MLTWKYDISEIKRKASEIIKRFLNGIKESSIDTDRLIKDIDQDIHNDLLKYIGRDVFNKVLKRHSKLISESYYYGDDLTEDGNTVIIYKTNDILTDYQHLINEVDESIEMCLSYGFAFEWFKANGYQVGTEYFAAEYDKHLRDAKSSSLSMHTRTKNNNPIY